MKKGRKAMIAGRPVVSFDTSVHNRMLDDGAAKSDAVFAGLKSGYFVCLTGLALEEMFATQDSSRRTTLIACTGRLQHGPIDILLPQNDILWLLILGHKAAPDSFDWKSVNVTTSDYARAFSDRNVIADNTHSDHAREDLKQRKKKFGCYSSTLRPKLDNEFERCGEARPKTFREVLPRIHGEGGFVWSIGKDLYDHAAETDASEATIRQFMGSGPPFRAIVYAMLLVWYHRSLRDLHAAEKFSAGGIDLLMAIYLPYCDQFITAEIGGEQEKCLREVANAADLKTEIRSYDDFCSSMMVSAG
jgi:hypothetical protein